MQIRKTGERGRYDVRDADCVGRKCLQPGEFQTRGATGASGSRATGAKKLCCLRRAYHGCPT